MKNKKAGKKSVSNVIRAFSETFQVFQLSSVSCCDDKIDGGDRKYCEAHENSFTGVDEANIS